jgi:hypothetical protein
VTSDDETRHPDPVGSNDATDAPTSRRPTGDVRSSGRSDGDGSAADGSAADGSAVDVSAVDGSAADGSAADEVRAALDDIESKPLADRAPDYLALADQLKSELERSDPSRDPNGR